jgi:hypothetical protein
MRAMPLRAGAREGRGHAPGGGGGARRGGAKKALLLLRRLRARGGRAHQQRGDAERHEGQHAGHGNGGDAQRSGGAGQSENEGVVDGKGDVPRALRSDSAAQGQGKAKVRLRFTGGTRAACPVPSCAAVLQTDSRTMPEDVHAVATQHARAPAGVGAGRIRSMNVCVDAHAASALLLTYCWRCAMRFSFTARRHAFTAQPCSRPRACGASSPPQSAPGSSTQRRGSGRTA